MILINILIVVRENPKILNVTSLQLTVFCCNCFKISSLEMISDAFSILEHTLVKPIIPLNLSESQLKNNQNTTSTH